MKSKNYYGWVLLVVALVIAFGAGAQFSQRGAESRGDSAVSNPEELLDKPAPQFSLRDKNGKEYTTENLRGKNVVLFFNEGLMCYPACWNQIVELGKDKRFQGGDTVALAVVVDRATDWQSAIEKMPELGFATTVFDTKRDASKKFGVLTAESSMHYGSLPGHTYVVIDKEGVVRFVYDDPRMAINNDLIVSKISMMNK